MKAWFALSLMVVAMSVHAQDFPKLKPGLWRIERLQNQPANANSPVNRTEFCTDEALQKEMLDMGQGIMKGMCSKHEFKITGNKGVGESVCDMGGTKMISRSTMTINGSTGYRTEVRTTFDPPMNGMKESISVIEAKYVDACKPGQKPGDMTLPNGQTMNMRDMMGAGKAAPK
ncbi:MAG TPA: DUF3617 family protein [Casimicrobiaceae bacterium]|nr:DUF3617 family protein [Casimicrobiaceae bacterium]